MFGKFVYSFALAAVAASQSHAMARHVPVRHACELQATNPAFWISTGGSACDGGRLSFGSRIRRGRELCGLVDAA
jgi:hypothetical protein